LLVSLFIEKLILDYTGVVEEKPDLLNDIKKERAILKELEEAESGAPMADTKAKGKGSRAAPDPDKIKQDLEDIRRFKATGWILIGFPQSLSQAKLLEQRLTGFHSGVDQEKTEDQQWSETWSKLVTPAGAELSISDVSAHPSGFENWLFIDADSSTCTSRLAGRKVDPTSNIVYHPWWNPTPEDPKIVDRLQDYTDESGAAGRMELNH
jgi:hypothetical protein